MQLFILKKYMKFTQVNLNIILVTAMFSYIYFIKICILRPYTQVICAISVQDDADEPESVGLCFWTLFQAIGLACVATIICRSILYNDGYFVTSSKTESTSITKEQYSNWHYSLTIIGFVYLYANCKYF